MSQPRVLIFAGGTKDGGGSVCEGLIRATVPSIHGGPPILDASIVGVVSHHPRGGVREIADRFGIPFTYFPEPWEKSGWYAHLVMTEYKANYVLLAGWPKLVHGLNPKRMLNIHPGPLPLTAGMFGKRVHETVLSAGLSQTEVTVHFATAECDAGPVIARMPVPVGREDTPETLGAAVKVFERWLYPRVAGLVLSRSICLNGKLATTLRLPPGYNIDNPFPLHG